MSRTVPASLLLFLSLNLTAQAPEIRSTAADRTELGITLYHGGYAMVRERRSVHLPAGGVHLALEDVAASIEPKTVQFRIFAGAPVNIRERNFEFDLLSPESLVKHSLGAKVWVPNPLVGAPPIEGYLAGLPTPSIYAPPRTPMEAKLDPMPPMERIARIYRGRFAKRRLVEHDPGAVVRLQDGFVPVSPGELTFTHRPIGLRSAPTLLMDLEATGPGPRSMEVAYLARNLNWHATYTAVLHPSAETMDLDAFVTLSNESRSAFPEASLQLLAGAPNRVPDPETSPFDPDISRVDTTSVMVAASVDPFKTERIGDNQLLTLGRLTTLAPNQTKQITLFSVATIPIDRKNILGISLQDRVVSGSSAELQKSEQKGPMIEWSSLDSRQTRIRFSNRRSNRLGRPLPQGQIYVQYLDRGGQQIPLFDEWFEETPVGETAEISLGPIAGLSGKWRMAEIKRSGWFRRNSRNATIEVKIVNDRSRTEQVEIQALVGADWELSSASHRGARERMNMQVFHVPAFPGETLFRATFLIPD